MGRRVVPWWQTAVIYQVYPRSFLDTSGDGIGDLEGVTASLSYLSDVLGIDAIWLSPFYRSPMVDFGYDVADHTDVDPIFGDLAAFDRLLTETHDRGLKVIVDFVPNHTSNQHPWFLESRASRDSEKREWYFWRDSDAAGGPPNNWLSMWGGSGWEWDAATEQYYYHHFSKEQPDLNWGHAAVRRAMFSVASFWLDRGVDGFRIDVADFIAKDPALRDNPSNHAGSSYHKSFGDYDSQDHLHDRRAPEMHAYYRELRHLIDTHDASTVRVSIGEIHCFDLEQWVSHYGENLDEIHLPFYFGLLKAPWTARGVREAVDALEAVLPAGAWPTYVLGNHDEPRFATRVGQAQARVGAMLLLTLRGTPTLYCGEELGLEDVPVPQAQRRDPQGRHSPNLCRDPARSPMPWSGGTNAGFCPADVAPWLPIGTKNADLHVEQQLEHPTSMLSLYRALTSIRRRESALSLGGYRAVDAPAAVYAFERYTDVAEGIRVVLNFGASEIESGVVAGPVLLSTYLDERSGVRGSVLRPHEGVILREE